jgi:hypothetical protein
MSGTLFKVSGIDPNDGVRIVFVWCRDEGFDNYALLGSGHVVAAGGVGLPPGISVGQFSVTFLLPYGRSASSIVVTDDKNGKEFLHDVIVTPCSVPAAFQPGVTVAPGDPAMCAGVTNASSRSVNRGQVVMAHSTGSET